MEEQPSEQVPQSNTELDFILSTPAFVFQDSASEVSSDYHPGSEASNSVRRILTQCSTPKQTTQSTNQSVPDFNHSTPILIETRQPAFAPPALLHLDHHQDSTINKPPGQRPHNSNSLPAPQPLRSNPLSPSSGDISSVTSASMTSAYNSSECDSSSVASPSHPNSQTRLDRHMKKQARRGDDNTAEFSSNFSATSGESSASGGTGLLGRLLRSNSQKSLTNNNSNSNPLHPFADQDEQGLLTSPTGSSSWALSTCISSIPEEQGDDRVPKSTIATTRATMDIDTKPSDSHKDVIAPALTHAIPKSTLPSPLSQRSLGTNAMDNSSVAMDSYASGLQSVATGFYSEATQVIRNGTGVPLPPRQRDIERGVIPIRFPNAPPPLSLIPSGRALNEVEGGEPQQPAKKNRSKQSVCRGTQAWIIGLLVALLIFGLITLVVSFVVSSKAKKNAASSASDDGYVFDYNPEGDDGTLMSADGGNNDTANNYTGISNFTNILTSVPTTEPSLEEDASLFVDAVEDLLTEIEPTPQPSFVPSFPPSASPSLAPSQKPTTAAGDLGNSLTITATPSQAPTGAATPRNNTAMPTESPTQPTPLLYPDATFTQEAHLWGENNGDAAGSSTALSGNGRILLMGSPNADSTITDSLERIGQVHVYEKITHQSSESTEWILRATLQGKDSLNQLGFSLAANYDGSVVVVSEPTAENRRGRVTIYAWKPNQLLYEAQQILRGTDTTDHFGISISLSDSGRRLAVGSPYHSTEASQDQSTSTLRGQVQVFEFSSETQDWEKMDAQDENTLIGPASLDWFGWSVSLSRNGEVLCVGAPRNTEFGGYVQCLRFDGSKWQSMGPPILNLVPPVKLDDRFGHAVSVTTTGSRPNSTEDVIRVAVGAPWKDVGNTLNSGMVAIYEWDEETFTWSMDADGALGSVLIEEEPGFYHQLGYSMTMDGDVVAVGVPGWNNRRGMVDFFWLPHAFGGLTNYDDTEVQHWNQLPDRLTGESAGDDFGFSVSLVLQRVQEDPASLVVASGAIMVSSSSPDSKGYSKVFQRGRVL